MLVIIANNLVPSVRGLLKVWCLEPKPNVFVTDLDEKTEERIIKFLSPYFKQNTGLLIINSNKKSLQGFTMMSVAHPNRKLKQISGLQFVSEKN